MWVNRVKPCFTTYPNPLTYSVIIYDGLLEDNWVYKDTVTTDLNANLPQLHQGVQDDNVI